MPSHPKFAELVNAAKERIQETDIATLKQKLDAADTFHLIDVREDREWNKGRVPGAIHIGKGVLERDINRATDDPNAEIVLYCGGGSRSALAAENLQRMGYTNVYSLEGGFGAWRDAGHEVETGEA